MIRDIYTSGLTLIEMLTVVAILVILAAAGGVLFARLEAHSRGQATKNLLAVLDGAMSAYVDIEGSFPVPPASVSEPAGRNQFLLVCLDSVPASRQLLELVDKGAFKDRWPGPGGGGPDGRFELYDAWDSALDYTYAPADSLPVIRSAGPDRIYRTQDDIIDR